MPLLLIFILRSVSYSAKHSFLNELNRIYEKFTRTPEIYLLAITENVHLRFKKLTLTFTRLRCAIKITMKHR